MSRNKNGSKADSHSFSVPKTGQRIFSGLNSRSWLWAKGFAGRWLIFAVLWWSLTRGEMSQWPLSFFFITASAFLSILLIPFQPCSVKGLLKFIPFFFHLSILGGIDVAGRALRPSMPLHSGFIDYHLNLRQPAARAALVWAVSLLPGTASINLKGHNLRIHVLDKTLSHEKSLKKLEERIRKIFKN
ncbi:MAG: Na+/H+ antiporter subunit E [Desulfonatronovibrio sp.]